MQKLVIGSACLLTALMLTFTIINADYHNARCVPAKQKTSVTGSACQPGAQLGTCEGSIYYQDIAIDGFCDPREAGDCYDASASFLICIGTFSVPCEWTPNGCVQPSGGLQFPSDALKNVVTVQSCD